MRSVEVLQLVAAVMGAVATVVTTLERKLVKRLRERGVLTGVDGPGHNVLKLRPPLIFNREDADLFLATLGDVLAEDGAQPAAHGRLRRPPLHHQQGLEDRAARQVALRWGTIETKESGVSPWSGIAAACSTSSSVSAPSIC